MHVGGIVAGCEEIPLCFRVVVITAVTDGVVCCRVSRNVINCIPCVAFDCHIAPCVVEVMHNDPAVIRCDSNYVILRIFNVIVFVALVSKAEVVSCFVIEEQHDLVPGLLPRKNVAVVEILGSRRFARLGKTAFKTQNHPLSYSQNMMFAEIAQALPSKHKRGLKILVIVAYPTTRAPS